MRVLSEVKNDDQNKTINHRYINTYKEDITCDLLHSVSSSTYYVLLCIPIFYFLTVGFFVWYYCKYRKIKNNYEKLRMLSESQGPDDDKKDDRQLGI
jgi:hypothetical protein